MHSNTLGPQRIKPSLLRSQCLHPQSSDSTGQARPTVSIGYGSFKFHYILWRDCVEFHGLSECRDEGIQNAVYKPDIRGEYQSRDSRELARNTQVVSSLLAFRLSENSHDEVPRTLFP